MNARLVGIAGAVEGKVYEVGEGDLSLGREPGSSICALDAMVSRRHCAVRQQEAGFKLVDLGSANGTYLNGVLSKESELRHGDEIRLGKCAFRFLSGQEEGVRFDDSSEAAGSTIVLQREDARYLSPARMAEEGPTALHLATLLKIGTALPTTQGLEALQRSLLESTLQAVPAERGVILLTGDVESTYQWPPRTNAAEAPPIPRSPIQRVISERVAIRSYVPEAVESDLSKSVRDLRVGSFMAAPLVAFEEVVGAIYLDTKDRGARFGEEELQLLAGIAGIAAAALQNALRFGVLESENQRLQRELHIEHSMIGTSPRMAEVYDFIAKVAPTNSTVLIRGETGTGKELVARAIHRNSPRSRKPFVAINCAALTETLLESEMFGHERGAFTGALVQKRGKLEEAHGGSVFLDEVGELTPALQAKLLRVLQEREFDRVGGTRPVKIDIRLIAATNRDLEAAVRQGTFRQDLYYRLNVVTIAMPPLRERRDDIPLLAGHFIEKHGAACARRIKGLSKEARACLMGYEWPGNVRELENAIERAAVLGSTSTILPEDLPDHIVEAGHPVPSGEGTFHGAVTEAKRQIILKALERAGGNYAEAARLLSLHPSNLHRLIRNLNLRAERAK
ncbi:MAG: sigma 54-interacting transcriptional regulator [Bryobacteraceae bacterium]